MPLDEASAKRYARKSAFLEFCEKDGLSVITGYGVADLKTAPLKYWERWGGPAAYCHLEGSQGFVGVLIAEIPPGKSLKPLRHMYEEQVLILSGRGATQFWRDGGSEPITLEWQPASLFSPPLNVRHQHHNGSATEPVRFATANNFPLVMNLYNSSDFVFSANYGFGDRFSGQKNFFSSEMKPGEQEDRVVNFIPDLSAVVLDPHPERGIGFSRLGIHLSGNSMVGHIMAVESGTYKKAHRHGPGAHVFAVTGSGYTLLWNEGDLKGEDGDFERHEWKHGFVFAPPDGMFHQHFNTSPEPARYLAVSLGSHRYPVLARKVARKQEPEKSVKDGGLQIDYADQDPRIHALWLKELAKTGVSSRMGQYFDETRIVSEAL